MVHMKLVLAQGGLLSWSKAKLFDQCYLIKDLCMLDLP